MVLTLRKVLISDEIDSQCIDILQRNDIEVVKNTKLTKEQLLQEIPKYDGLIVRSATKVTSDVIDAATNLKIIGRAGTGVDNIDCNAATRRGIIVMNTPGGNTLSAAELTCTLVLTTARHVAQGTESLKAGRWDRKKYMGNEVFGKTLAIVGLGRIGKEVALRMQSFGMTTIGYDPIIPASVSEEFNTEWLHLEDLWPKADYITVHTPLIPQTKNLINDEVFAKCKKGVRVINCARGGIIDEDALLRALQSGQCGGAGLDVFLEEPPTNRALCEHPLVTCTPHLGASTVEAQSRVAVEIAEQFVDVINGRSLFGAINSPALTHALSDKTKPLVALGITLGKLAIELGPTEQLDKHSTVIIKTYGESLTKGGSYLSAAALVGLLGRGSTKKLNLVNSPALAKELHIQVKTEHSDAIVDGYSELVALTLQQSDGSLIEVDGIVAGGKPVLVKINGASLKQCVVLEENILVYKSQANNQVLAAVTGAVSASNSSITGVSVSSEVNGEIWTLLQLTAPITDVAPIKLHVNLIKQMQF